MPRLFVLRPRIGVAFGLGEGVCWYFRARYRLGRLADLRYRVRLLSPVLLVTFG